jgi:hypothetical protein
MKGWSFFQPKAYKLAALGLLLLLWIMPTSRMAVMKGTWEIHHGFPFTFIFLIESTVGGIYRIWISGFDIAALITDVAILYLVSCIISFLVLFSHSAQPR